MREGGGGRECEIRGFSADSIVICGGGGSGDGGVGVVIAVANLSG